MTIKVNPRYALLAGLQGAQAGLAQRPNGKAENHKAGKVTIKEKDLQAMAEDLCILLGIRFFRIPDKLMAFLANFAPKWVRVFCSRYLAGVPDLMLFKRLPEGDNIVRFIEIKTEAGKIHQAQKKWHTGLNVMVCYGWDETERAIREFHTPSRKDPP